MIVFANEPSVGIYDFKTKKMNWCHRMTNEHELFEQIFGNQAITYYCMDDILLIPIKDTTDAHTVYIEDQVLECSAQQLVICHYQEIYGAIVATSLQLPEYEYFRKNLQILPSVHSKEG